MKAMKAWSVQDSADVYNIRNWGKGYFGINKAGHVTVAAVCLGGAAAGLIAVNELMGSEHRMVLGFTAGFGFIGIAVPHLARMLFNTSSHRTLMPASCLIGAILLLSCDCIAQWPGTQTVLPINIITSLVGAPVVVFLLVRRKNFNIR